MTLDTELLYQQTRHQFLRWYGPQTIELAACVYWALAGFAVLRRAGLNPLIQAGSLYWRILPRELDDGRANTHFSYQWEPLHPHSLGAIIRGELPEMHIWIALRLEDGPVIADFSTSTLKREAVTTFGIDWRTPDPPRYVLGKPPRDACYEPKMDAILLALRILPEAHHRAMAWYGGRVEAVEL